MILLLLYPTNDRRFLGEDLLYEVQTSRDARTVPHLVPIAQIWMIDPPVYSHMLSRPDDHVFAWHHIDDRCILRVCLGDPQLEGEAICSAPEVDWQSTGDSKQQGRGAAIVGVDFGAWAEGGEDGEGVRGV